MSHIKSSPSEARSQVRFTDPDLEKIIPSILENPRTENARTNPKALAQAAYLLGVISQPDSSLLQGDSYNQVIDALDAYRDDWRGYVVNINPKKPQKDILKAEAKKLRAKGATFKSISKTLDININTAYSWAKNCKKEVVA